MRQLVPVARKQRSGPLTRSRSSHRSTAEGPYGHLVRYMRCRRLSRSSTTSLVVAGGPGCWSDDTTLQRRRERSIAKRSLDGTVVLLGQAFALSAGPVSNM